LTPAQEDAIWDALKEELTNFRVKTSPYQLRDMQTVHVDQVALLECIRKNIKSKIFVNTPVDTFWKAFEESSSKDLSMLVRGILSIPASTHTLEMHAIIRDYMQIENYSFERTLLVSISNEVCNFIILVLTF